MNITYAQHENCRLMNCLYQKFKALRYVAIHHEYCRAFIGEFCDCCYFYGQLDLKEPQIKNAERIGFCIAYMTKQQELEIYLKASVPFCCEI